MKHAQKYLHEHPEELKRLCDELLSHLGGPDGEEARRAARVHEPLDQSCLERWVLARKGDLKHAEHDLRKHIAWRYVVYELEYFLE